MAPQPPPSPRVQSGSHGRRHKASPFVNWLKKTDDTPDTSKLASPAEEIKLVFLHKLQLGDFDVDGKRYHSVFTGTQIVDIIKGHFGLPDRQLACNVASRLIDCSLYRHVSGPSGGLGDVCVVDSNEDIYTLTPDAHAMMNSIHGSDRSRAAIPTQLKTPRPTTMRPSATARVTPASINILIPPTRVTAAEISSAPARNMPLPPPVDTSESEQSTHSDSVAAHVHSPSDTLVTRATSSETTKREFVPQTPTTVCLSPSVQESGESSHSANTGSSSSLQNVQIPDSNLEGLLNSWSFISESYQSTSNSHALRASVPSTPKPPQSPLVDLPDPRRRTTPLDSPGSSVKGKMSMDSDLDEDLPSDDDGEGWAKHAVRVRRRWAVYNMEQANNPRRSSGSARHYPSAPSLFDQYSDAASDTTFRESQDGARHSSARPSMPFPHDRDTLGALENSPRLSDITIANEFHVPRHPPTHLPMARSFDRPSPHSVHGLPRATSDYVAAYASPQILSEEHRLAPRPATFQALRDEDSDSIALMSTRPTSDEGACESSPSVYQSPAMSHDPNDMAVLPILSNNVSESSTRQSGMASSEMIDGSMPKRNGEALTPLTIPQDTFSGSPPSAASVSGPPSAPLSRITSPVTQDLGSFSFAASASEEAEEQQKRQGALNTGNGSKYHSLVTSNGLSQIKSMRKYTTPEPYNPDSSPSVSRTHTRASSVGFPLFMNRTSLGSNSSPSPALTMAHIGHDMIMIGRDSVDRASTAVDEEGYMYGSVGKQLNLWRDTIPQDMLLQLEQSQIDQQEAIHELIMTEHDYLRDMELIDAIYVQPLMADRNVMEEGRAKQFLDTLFFNFRDLISDSHELCARLAERQAQAPVVDQVGDIFIDWANKHLKNFIEYSVHVPISQAELEAELLRSPPMAEFLKQAETSPEARRLPIQSFIGRPATRFARYPLLINAIIKRSGETADTAVLKQVVEKVKHALDEIDLRTGKGAESIRIRQISQRLELSKSARDSLALDAPARRLIKEGVFSVAEGGQVLVFLFDNSLIMATETKVPHAKGISRYIADERIVPISMLDATVPAVETGALMGIREVFGLQTGRSALMRHTPSSSSIKGRQAGVTASGRAPLTFLHIACRTLCRTLLASSLSDRDAWIEAVHKRVCVPQTLVEAYTETRILSDRDFVPGRAPVCSAPFLSSTGCQMILFGNKDGMFMGIYGVPTSIVRVSHATSISKIHVLRKFNMVIALSDTSLLVFSLSAIEKSASSNGSVPSTKIASSVGFFDVGTYVGTPLIVLMKPRGSRSHFKCIQPYMNEGAAAPETSTTENASTTGRRASSSSNNDQHADSSEPAVRTIRVVYQGSRASLRLISDFSLPGKTKKVHFLRRKLCIVGASNFEIVDVQTGASLRTLPDALDDDFSFIAQFDSGQALAVCKVGKEFLLCYEEFAFFIDNFGRRSRPNVFVRWEMRPTLVTFRYPYLVAVNPKFLEIRHMETGVLLSVVRLHKAVCLNPDSKSIVLHIAVKPSSTGLVAGTGSQSSATQSQASDKGGSTKAQSPVVAESSTGNVVPGLAGIDGTRTFPEGNASFYRVIEVRLPPLKTSK